MSGAVLALQSIETYSRTGALCCFNPEICASLFVSLSSEFLCSLHYCAILLCVTLCGSAVPYFKSANNQQTVYVSLKLHVQESTDTAESRVTVTAGTVSFCFLLLFGINKKIQETGRNKGLPNK